MRGVTTARGRVATGAAVAARRSSVLASAATVTATRYAIEPPYQAVRPGEPRDPRRPGGHFPPFPDFSSLSRVLVKAGLLTRELRGRECSADSSTGA